MRKNIVVLLIDSALVFSAVGEIVPEALAMLGSVQRIQHQVQQTASQNNETDTALFDRLQVLLIDTLESGSQNYSENAAGSSSREQLKNNVDMLNRIADRPLRVLSTETLGSQDVSTAILPFILDTKDITMVTLSVLESMDIKARLGNISSKQPADKIQHWIAGDPTSGVQTLADVERRVKELLTEPIARTLPLDQRKGSLFWLSTAPNLETLLSLVYRDASIEWILLPTHSESYAAKKEMSLMTKTNTTASSGALIYTEFSHSKDELLHLPESKLLTSRIKRSQISITYAPATAKEETLESEDKTHSDEQLLSTDQYLVTKTQTTSKTSNDSLQWGRFAFRRFKPAVESHLDKK